MSSATTNSEYSLDPKLVDRILAEVREDEIISMSSDVINIPSPTGEELQMAQYMQSELQKIGLDVTWQEVEEARANVVGRWKGGGTHTGPAFSDFLVGSLPAASGRKMRFTGTTVLRVENGKIAEEIGLDDGVTALQQLGLLRAA